MYPNPSRSTLPPQSASHAGLYGVDLEPDPRYQRCCSNVFRPGRVLRDCCLGLLVLFVIAAVIGAMFLLVFFVLKGGDEAEAAVWIMMVGMIHGNNGIRPVLPFLFVGIGLMVIYIWFLFFASFIF